MSDRKLLELAAKAAGLTINAKAQAERDAAMDPEAASLWLSDGTTAWNPRTNNGDALWLAVTLGIIVGAYSKERFARVSWLQRPHDGDPKGVTSMLVEPVNGDPLAATRRAIVRAAAAIGEKMP